MKPPFIVVVVIAGKRLYAMQISEGFILSAQFLEAATFMHMQYAIDCLQRVRAAVAESTPDFNSFIVSWETELFTIKGTAHTN
ncbi:MAG: hypothetical protein WC716_16795 [Chitinophagaceae bacterium]|jgi:hypothetical protein